MQHAGLETDRGTDGYKGEETWDPESKVQKESSEDANENIQEERVTAANPAEERSGFQKQGGGAAAPSAARRS
jgi:hypothetical protein